MKRKIKKICLTAAVAVLTVCLCSCSKMVSFIRFPSSEDSTRYNEIFEVKEVPRQRRRNILLKRGALRH